jgi:prefoldin subunit 5
MAAIDALKDEIEELESEGEKIRASEISLQDLEEKFQKHFKSWHQGQKA